MADKLKNSRYTKKKKRKAGGLKVISVILMLVAFIFLIPIVFTICNSFMTQQEITANYGMVFESTESGARPYISETVNLKFIPDKVTFDQYLTVLLKSPDYLFKFWNSVILVAPIVIFQLFVALLAAYGFTRCRSRLKEIIFFIYIIFHVFKNAVVIHI